MANCVSLRDELLNEPAQPLLRENEGNPFRDSWEAEAFAMGNLLIKSGFMTAGEWIDIFSEEIKRAQALGDEDRGDTYYNHWMNALERIMIERGIVDAETLEQQQQLWELAISKTPHGVALELENAYLDLHEHHDGHDHDHGHHHSHGEPGEEKLKPVFVSTINN